jgi:hypothetical protein
VLAPRAPKGRKRTWGRQPWEWLPTPFAGRIMVPNKNKRDKQDRPAGKLPDPLYVQLMPGPNGSVQWVRVHLNHPFARGFRNPEQARGWLARAVKAGVVPEGVVEIEPPQVPADE